VAGQAGMRRSRDDVISIAGSSRVWRDRQILLSSSLLFDVPSRLYLLRHFLISISFISLLTTALCSLQSIMHREYKLLRDDGSRSSDKYFSTAAL
jgi:hypothetical protein